VLPAGPKRSPNYYRGAPAQHLPRPSVEGFGDRLPE
jgi:hypothetical protein